MGNGNWIHLSKKEFDTGFWTRMWQTYDLATQFSNVYGTVIGANETTDEVVRVNSDLSPDVESQRIPGVIHTPDLEKSHLIVAMTADFLARCASPPGTKPRAPIDELDSVSVAPRPGSPPPLFA